MMSIESSPATIQTREFSFSDAPGSEYLAALRLRTKILRDPLGLKFDPADLAREVSDFHLGAFEGERIVGCLILTRVSDATVKMRQVAVDSEMQGRRIGRKLVEHSEKLARQKGFAEIVLSARDTAVPFYLALQYALVGEPFTEVGIPHQKMRKTI